MGKDTVADTVRAVADRVNAEKTAKAKILIESHVREIISKISKAASEGKYYFRYELYNPAEPSDLYPHMEKELCKRLKEEGFSAIGSFGTISVSWI